MSKYEKNEGAARGQKLRTETGRDRSDDAKDFAGATSNKLPNDEGDISHSIKNGKVPRDA